MSAPFRPQTLNRPSRARHLQFSLNLLRETKSSRGKSSFSNQNRIAYEIFNEFTGRFSLAVFINFLEGVFVQNIDCRNRCGVAAEVLIFDQGNG